ncbi:MAG TPA: hypothetical protein VK028_06940 [Micromonosporaceae bacterium]|nr:hypothetical protein [Micromonosporaceae bacterium]
MGRARVGMVVAIAALAATAGCVPPSDPPAPPAQNTIPVAPTDPVGADGQPIENLCDLLTADEFAEIASVSASAPDTSGVTDTAATCRYAENAELTVLVTGSVDEAIQKYQEAVSGEAFATVVKEGPIGGVDESLHAVGTDSAGLALRRQRLVVSIVMPGTPEDGEIKLIQLAARVLSRVHALGA